MNASESHFSLQLRRVTAIKKMLKELKK